MFWKSFPAVILILLSIATSGVTAQAATIIRLPEAEIALNQVEMLVVVLVCPASNCIGIDVTVAYDAPVLRIDECASSDRMGHENPKFVETVFEQNGRQKQFAPTVSVQSSLISLKIGFTKLV